ncbi:hypothetical protein BQ8482_120103 [Mesorhizobium delmotii]|uniref:Uncharacterized protein n=1 Tax=Mesorhizobium delmotii TaxID=1631247 RepID=A0A2P9AFZ1_9HYPH|nr:hypothetical protein BQ8482_120103 [Mesorhizobium delmotii]
MSVIAHENLAAAPTFSPLPGLGLLILAILMLGRVACLSVTGPRLHRAAIVPDGGWACLARRRRRSPGHAHFRRAGAGVVVFHFSSFRRRANRRPDAAGALTCSKLPPD